MTACFWRMCRPSSWLAILGTVILCCGTEAPKPRCTCERAPQNDRGLLCVEDPTFGCILAEDRTFPSWDILSSGAHLMPDRTTLLMALSQGGHVVLVSPDAHTSLAVSQVAVTSLSILHHSEKSLACIQATMRANGLHARAVTIVHGIPSVSGSSKRAVRMSSPPLSLEDFYSNSPRQWEDVVLPQVPWPHVHKGYSLFVLGQSPGQVEAVQAAARACSGACSLVVALDYDAEGAVFGAESLQVLQSMRALEAARGHRCFWHMSDWAAAGLWGGKLGPVLDIVCLHVDDARSPPGDTKVLWERDVNRQLSMMIKAFAPDFARRHMFTGVIKPAVCLNASHLCEGPSVPLRQFTPSKLSRYGDPMNQDERADSTRATELIHSVQAPEGGCSHVLVFCFVNPELAGHGAQVHSMAFALSYAVASGRSLVLNESCAWDLHPTALKKGFFAAYMQPVSTCAPPTSTVTTRPRHADSHAADADAVAAGGEHAPPRGPHALLWDSDVDRMALSVPHGGASWCSGTVFDRSCAPPAFRRYGPAWWTSHLVSYILRPSAGLESVIAESKEQLLVRLGGGPVLGIHVRRGHKYIEIPPTPGEQLLQPITTFLDDRLQAPNLDVLSHTRTEKPRERAERVAALCGGNACATALVATEDHAVVDELSHQGTADSLWSCRSCTDKHGSHTTLWTFLSLCSTCFEKAENKPSEIQAASPKASIKVCIATFKVQFPHYVPATDVVDYDAASICRTIKLR